MLVLCDEVYSQPIFNYLVSTERNFILKVHLYGNESTWIWARDDGMASVWIIETVNQVRSIMKFLHWALHYFRILDMNVFRPHTRCIHHGSFQKQVIIHTASNGTLQFLILAAAHILFIMLFSVTCFPVTRVIDSHLFISYKWHNITNRYQTPSLFNM